MNVVTAVVAGLLTVVLSIVGNEVFAVMPWFTRKVIRWVARIDADSPDEIALIYDELMTQLREVPGKLSPLCLAIGFLFKVAVVRRAVDAWRVATCAMRIRVVVVSRWISHHLLASAPKLRKPVSRSRYHMGGTLNDAEIVEVILLSPRDRARYLLQRRMAERAEMATLLSQLQSLRH